MGERCGDQPAGGDLSDPASTLTGEQGVAFDPVEGVGDRLVVGLPDQGGEVGIGQCPQRRHVLHRGEGEVESGDRLRWGGHLRDESVQLVAVQRLTAVLAQEQLGADLAAQPGSEVPSGCRREGSSSGGGVVAAGDLELERGRLLELREPLAQSDRSSLVAVGRVRAERVEQQITERVAALREQVLHLLGGDHVPGLHAQPGQARAHPASRCFAGGLVVVGELHPSQLGGVHRSDLTGQVVVSPSR